MYIYVYISKTYRHSLFHPRGILANLQVVDCSQACSENI